MKNLSNQHGNALSIVLVFSVSGLIAVTVYLSAQHQLAQNQRTIASGLQALANARSGIIAALPLVHKQFSQSPTDTLKRSTLAAHFGSELFESNTPPSLQPLSIDSAQRTLQLYSDSRYGASRVELRLHGTQYQLASTGTFRTMSRELTVSLAGRLPASQDTTILLKNSFPFAPYAQKPEGTVVQFDSAQTPPTLYGLEPVPTVLTTYLTALRKWLARDSVSVFERNPPLHISHPDELKQLRTPVKGSLVLDGSHNPLTWQPDSCTIIGDLQTTGDVTIQNAHLAVEGQVKLFDKTRLRKCFVYTPSEVSIGDKALLQATIVTEGAINVFGQAQFLYPSTLVACGAPLAKADSTTAANNDFAITLSEQASLDATIIALRTPGAIKVTKEVKVRGIVWAAQAVCHRGSLKGVLCAQRLIACNDSTTLHNSLSSNENMVGGTIEILRSITQYTMPCFFGNLVITGWSE